KVATIEPSTITPNNRLGISISIIGIVRNSLIAINAIKPYAVVSNSGTISINLMIISAIPRIARIPINPPIKTITGLGEIANEAKTESTENTISIISIDTTTDQNSGSIRFLAFLPSFFGLGFFLR